MSKSNTLENAILALIYNATAIADLAQDDGSSPATHIAVALHTADPGEGGNASTNEANYTGYTRINVVRTSSGWTVSGNAVTNAATISFPACTGGSNSITHFSTSVPGNNTMLHYGALNNALAVSNGITPTFPAGDLDITED